MEKQSLPKTYKGYSTEELLNIWEEIRSPKGTSAPKEKILAMSQMIREFKLGIFSKIDKEPT
jgi:hypothetical protein